MVEISGVLKAGHVKPPREIVRRARSGAPMDFCHGVEVVHLPGELLDVATLHGYAPSEPYFLGLRGTGSVLPHDDDPSGDATLLWLLADTQRHGPSTLMVAGAGDNCVCLEVGDVVLFDPRVTHAWVSRSSWVLAALDVRRMQHHG